MKKNNFKLDIFFNELSNNLLNKRTNLDAIISKAVDNEDVYWEGDEEDGKMLGYGVDGMDNIIHFNPNYFNPEAVFPMLDSSLKYENIFRVFSHDINPHNVRVNYGYLSSNKKDISLLFKNVE